MAASLAPSTIGLRVIVAATVGHDNPVELAEQVAVADLTLNGRLVLAVRPAVDAADRLGEVLDLLADCFGAHPFRHEGPVWPTPANLPANVFNLETRVRVTPPPAQLELPLWVQGAAGRAAAAERALGVVFDAAETAADAAAWWATTHSAQPALARRMRRAAHWVVPIVAGELAVDAAVAELRAWQRAVDLDLVVAAAEIDLGGGAPRTDGRADARGPPPRPARPLPARARGALGRLSHRRNLRWLRPTSSTPSARRWASAAAGCRRCTPLICRRT